jgi:hypothetical protein
MTNEQDREQEARVVAIMAAILRASPTEGGGWGTTVENAVLDARSILAESRKQVQEGR